MLLKNSLLAAAAVLALAGASTANAATVVLQNTTAAWQNVVGGAHVNYSGANTSSATVRWGSPSYQPQSGYRFTTAGNNISVTLPPSPTDPFQIGTFTHFNEPINVGSSITSAQLKLTTTVLIDGLSQGLRTFLFDFQHNETLNTGYHCCSDIVTFATNDLSDAFQVGNTVYTLNLSGFWKDGQLLDQFSSKEGKTNSAKLYATVDATTIPGVPEPATWLTMLAGFGLVGSAMRRQRKVATVLA